MKEKQLKEAVKEPKEVNGAPGQDAEVKNDVAEEAIKEETEKLKLKYSAKVNLLISDKELQEKLHKLFDDAIEDAIVVGRAAGMTPGAMEFMTDSVKNAIDRAVNPTDAFRAERYKTLYMNQRVITSHLQAAAQLLQLQVGEYETLGNEPFANPFRRTMGDVLGATALGMGSLKECCMKSGL